MSSQPEKPRLATVTIPAPDLRPDVFLRHAEGEQRGYWARDDRWVAHRGVAAQISGSGDPEVDRFEEAAETARELAMDPLLLLEQVFNGLQFGIMLFLIAAGLTIVAYLGFAYL